MKVLVLIKSISQDYIYICKLKMSMKMFKNELIMLGKIQQCNMGTFECATQVDDALG